MATLLDVLRERLLPCFDGISEEADAKAQDAFDRMAGLPGGENGPVFEPAEAHEMARDVGLEHYQALVGARQTLVNSFAVSMFHLWEQQVIGFLRREVLHPKDKNKGAMLSVKKFQDEMLRSGIDLTRFGSWEGLQEFRLLANAVKHAEGPAAAQLRTRRPEWFTPPAFRNDPVGALLMTPSVYEPLAGEDVYVDIEDLELLAQHADRFWTDLVDALEAASRPTE